MSFSVLIPARLASSRLPNKPLEMIAGLPMVVRVAKQMDILVQDGIQIVVVCDAPTIIEACHQHGVRAILTRTDHASGTDRLAEASEILQLADDSVVVNVQGDEPLMQASLVREVAQMLLNDPNVQMSTAAHHLQNIDDLINPNVVKTVLNKNNQAMYFSRAPIPWLRDGNGIGARDLSEEGAPLRHIGIYGYRAGFLRRFPKLPQPPLERIEALEQLRALWNGFAISVHIASSAPGIGVDTPEDLARIREMFDSRLQVTK